MRIAFAYEDKGGYEAIFPLYKELSKDNETIFLIFQTSKLLEFKPDLLVAGTSSGINSLDKKAMALAKKHKIRVIAVMDYWGNYWNRFHRDYLPDTICVIDETMKKDMVEQGFPEKILKITGTPRFDCFSNRVVFFSQPLKGLYRTDGITDRGYDEFDVMRDLREVLKDKFRLIVKLHPKEEIDKFQGVNVVETDSMQLIAESRLVIGMYGAMLLKAWLMGKRIISYQPNLSTEDPFILGRKGITKTITSKDELKKEIGKEKYITPNATRNIIRLIR